MTSGSTRSQHHLLLGEGVAEVAPVAVGTHVAGKDHPADLSLVTWVPDHRTQLRDAMRELAVVAVRARASLLPLVAQLRLEHPLAVHFELQCLLLFLPTRHVHALLHLRRLLCSWRAELTHRSTRAAVASSRLVQFEVATGPNRYALR